MANQSLPQYFKKPFQNFDGGLCTRIEPTKVPANQFVQLDNAILADHDILEKAPGYALDGSPFPATADSFIRMLVNYRLGVTSNSLVAAALDAGNTNSTYKVDLKQTFGDGNYAYIGYTVGTASFVNGSNGVTGSGTLWLSHLKSGDKIKPNSGGTWYEIQTVNSNTSITLTANYAQTSAPGANYMARIILSANEFPFGLVFNDKLIITNGSEVMMEFDNVTMALMQDTDAPKAKLLEKHKNRVFAAKTSSGPSELFWSDVNDETIWDAAGKTTVYAQDNGGIVAIKSFANSLLVFKDNGLVYRVIGEFDQDEIGAPSMVYKLDCPDNLGIIAGKTVVVNDDNKLYFLAETGYYTIDSYMQFEKISWDISPTIANLIFRSTSNQSKQFTFQNKTQFDSGIHTGTHATPAGLLTSFCDQYAVTDAYETLGNGGVDVDASYNIWFGYLNKNAPYHPAVAWWAADGTRHDELLAMVPTQPTFSVGGTYRALDSCQLQLRSTGQPGVAWRFGYFDGSGVPQAIAQAYTERSTGNATFVVGSAIVTGSGTSWLTTAQAGAIIKNAADGSFATILTVDSDTHITLTAGYVGTASTDAPYVFWSFPVNVYEGDGLSEINVATFAFEGSPPHPPAIQKSTNSGGLLSGGTFVYDASDDPRFILPLSYFEVVPSSPSTKQTTVYYRDLFVKRVSSTYSYTTAFSVLYYSQSNFNSTVGTFPASGGIDVSASHAQIVLNSTDLYINGIYQLLSDLGIKSYIRAYKSTNSGSSWTLLDSTNTLIPAQSYYQIQVTTAGHSKTAYQDIGNTTIARDHVSQSNATVDPSTSGMNLGYSLYGNNPYAFGNDGVSGHTLETYILPSAVTITSSPSQNTLRKVSSNRFVNFGFITHDGSVFGTAAWSSNINTIMIRRVAFTANWKTQKTTDSTLTSWGNYVVTGQTNNGATVAHQIALGATSTLGSPVSITSGSLVSNDNTKVWFQVTVTITLSTLSSPTIASIVLNYFGSGVDAKAPVSFVYNNEMYTAVAETGQAADNTISFLDRRHAWGNYQVPASLFARMGTLLYAGSSTGGNVYRLKQGLDFAGSTYPLRAVTKEDFLGAIELDKDVSKVYIIFKPQAGTFTFSYRLDSYKTTGGSTWVDKVIDQSFAANTPGYAEVEVGQTCSTIQFQILQNDKNVNVGIIGLTVLYGYLNLR